MSDLNISSIASNAKPFRLTSKTEVSMETITPQERILFSQEATSIHGESQKIQEGLKLSSEIKVQLESQLQHAYFNLFVSKEI